MSKRAFLSALSGLWGWLFTAFLNGPLCVPRGRSRAFPSGNEDRRGGVQNNTKRPSSEKPRTRVFCYSVRIFVFVRLRLNCLVPKQLQAEYYLLESAACFAANKTVHDLVDLLVINLWKKYWFFSKLCYNKCAVKWCALAYHAALSSYWRSCLVLFFL